MKPTKPNAHTYVEDNDVKVSIMTGSENVNAQTYRRTMEQRHCSDSVFSPRQQHWRRNAVARYCLQLSQFKTCRKERFCSFPHRHGEATGKPATRDKTRGCKPPAFRTRLPPIFTVGNMTKGGFAASPIDTAKPRDNQRLETRRVGAPKRAFCARLPPIFTLCSFKIDVFLRVFLRT